MLDSRRCQEEAAVNRPKIAGASGRFFALFRVPVLGTDFGGVKIEKKIFGTQNGNQNPGPKAEPNLGNLFVFLVQF